MRNVRKETKYFNRKDQNWRELKEIYCMRKEWERRVKINEIYPNKGAFILNAINPSSWILANHDEHKTFSSLGALTE